MELPQDGISNEGLEERLDKLLNEGRRVEATSPLVDTNKKPAYFDEKRFKEAQKTCQKHYSNISFGSLSGLLLLVQNDRTLIPLLKTGRSRTVADLYERYMMTAKYIKRCYETDFYQTETDGWKYIQLVRGMHQRIHKIMNEEEESLPLASNEKWVNQYDMALTQFGFVGLFLIRPDKCAAYYISEQELSQVSYYWRLLSYYFGIEDRFNLFVYDDFNQQREYLNLVLRHMTSELDKVRNPIGTEMAKGIMLSFEDLAKEFSFTTIDFWWRPTCFISDAKEKNPHYTLEDRWKLVRFFIIFRLLYRVEFLVEPFNAMYKRKFIKFCEKADEIKPKLEKKYSHLEYV